MIRQPYPEEQPCIRRPDEYRLWLREYLKALSPRDWNHVISKGNGIITWDGISADAKINAFLKANPYPVEYWNCTPTQTKDNMYGVLYACAQLGGSIPGIYCLHSENQFSKRDNARHTVSLRIKLPMGYKDRFEKLSGVQLIVPPGVVLD